MNVGIVLKIEYKIDGAADYSELSYSGFSASYTTEAVKSRAGFSYRLKLTCKVPKIDSITSGTISGLVGRKLRIKFQDANGNWHYAGTTSYPVRLIFKESIQGGAGSFNGYEIIFSQESPVMHTITGT